MFKRLVPKKIEGRTYRLPHCDSRMLHAPGECEFCDLHPDFQSLRQDWGIAFTGYEPEGTELPCPSDNARGLGGAHVWGGNRPLLNDPNTEPKVVCK